MPDPLISITLPPNSVEQTIAVLGLVGAAFFLWKLRNEENLRTRLALASELYETFSHLNEVIRDWSNPRIFGNEDKYERLARDMSAVAPRAQSAFHRASLIMPPEIRATIYSIFEKVGMMDAEFQNYLMFKESNAGAPGAYLKEVKETFEKSRSTLPAEIDAAHKELHKSLEIIVNGYLKAWWWRRRARKLMEANLAARRTGTNTQ